MEFEIADEPRDEDYDSQLIRDHSALLNQSSVDPEEYPHKKDRALHIPEEENGS